MVDLTDETRIAVLEELVESLKKKQQVMMTSMAAEDFFNHVDCFLRLVNGQALLLREIEKLRMHVDLVQAFGPDTTEPEQTCSREGAEDGRTVAVAVFHIELSRLVAKHGIACASVTFAIKRSEGGYLTGGGLHQSPGADLTERLGALAAVREELKRTVLPLGPDTTEPEAIP